MYLGDNEIIPVAEATNLNVGIADNQDVTCLQCIPSELHPIVSHDVDYQFAILLRDLNDFLAKQKLVANIVVSKDPRINTE